MKQTLDGKHIVVGISGGIAAYKTVSLIRLLIKNGAEVQVVMTPNAKEFITPVTLSAITSKPVVIEFFSANTGEWHSHVDLGLWADLMVVAPATASSIGKMANGVADNMLVTTYLSAKEPVMIAPAMDLDMMRHPSTIRNLKQLEDDGVTVLEPESGELASGLVGKGRMMEPEEILKAIVRFFESENNNNRDFKGKNILITAGPTIEHIDPVRFIGNHSSGKMGFSIAEEFHKRGAFVTVIAGPVGKEMTLSPGIKRVDVTTAMEMYKAALEFYPKTSVAVFTAAVADYRAKNPSDTKIKREQQAHLNIELIPNPDIAAELGRLKSPLQINVGFALETENEEGNAEKKMMKKNLDMVILNSLRDKGAGFDSDTNKITIFGPLNKKTEFALKSKRECAKDIVDAIAPLCH